MNDTTRLVWVLVQSWAGAGSLLKWCEMVLVLELFWGLAIIASNYRYVSYDISLTEYVLRINFAAALHGNADLALC